MSSPERPTKRQAFQALLREGWTSIHLDARRPGVVVPPNLKGEAHLVLQYGHDLPIPIPDLEVDEYGVRATLSFSRAAHRTVVPWDAVYVVACDDGRGVLYAEDVPKDVAVIAGRARMGDAGDRVDDDLSDDAASLDLGGEVSTDEDMGGPGPRAARLRSVPADPAADVMDAPMAAVRRRRRPQLRLVK
jgi:stringent starvation protein B